MARTKIYFASDFHLGAPNEAVSAARERKIIAWLDSISDDVAELYLVGDIFDFWFEYKHAVPKGFIRFLGKLALLRDAGVAIHIFIGNHDLWLGDYLTKELGIIVHYEPLQIERNGQYFFIAHGDGLGPGDKNYKCMKRIFTNPLCKWLFKWLHPDLGIGLASFLSRRSRAQQSNTETFLGKENEWLYLYSNRKVKSLPHINYFIFGHRHLPLDLVLENESSRYINLGEWLHSYTYGVFDGQEMKLLTYTI